MCMLMLMTWASAGRGVVPVTVRHNVHPMIGRAGYLILDTGRVSELGTWYWESLCPRLRERFLCFGAG